MRWRRSVAARGGGPVDQEQHELDRSLAPVAAFMSAPAGSSPCESAFNAYQAFGAKAQELNMKLPWDSFPDHATFIARCTALPEQSQLCLSPQYQAKNLSSCNPILEQLRANNVLFVQRP